MTESTYLIMQNLDTGLFSVTDENGNEYISGLASLDAAREWLEEQFRLVDERQRGQPNGPINGEVKWH